MSRPGNMINTKFTREYGIVRECKELPEQIDTKLRYLR